MTRLLPAWLACALALSGQIAVTDAVVTDAAGRAVTNLTPADFEVMEDGKARPVVRLTAFDAVRHTATTIGELPALDLTPDQIHRTLAIVVDDLCLSDAGLHEVRRRVQRMVETQLVPGDRVAILRTSSGTAREQQFRSDPAQIARAASALQYLGGGISRQSCASAAWSAVSYALTGLSTMAGRKAVVLMSGDLPAPGAVAGGEIARLAAKSATALYMTAAVAPMLAAQSGGAAGVDLERAFEEQRAFYVLGFTAGSGRDVLVKLRRPDLVLRSRLAPIGQPARVEVPSPPTPAELARQVMSSPFEGDAIGLRLTALFSIDPKAGAIVQALLHIDGRDLSYLRGASREEKPGPEERSYHVEFEVHLASVLESGQLAQPATVPQAIHLTAEEYRRMTEEGLVYAFNLSALTPGARQVRAAVMDSRSGRSGTASAFAEVHDLMKGGLFLSGILLHATPPSAKASPAVRVFRAGQPLSFSYSVYNATTAQDGRVELESQARIFADGHEIHAGRATPLQFEPVPNARRRQVNGTISLDPSIGLGRYVLQVTVKDKLGAEPRSASQFIEFTIEQ